MSNLVGVSQAIVVKPGATGRCGPGSPLLPQLGTWIHINNAANESAGTDFVNAPLGYYVYVLEWYMSVLTNPLDADTDLNIGSPNHDFTNQSLMHVAFAGEAIPDWKTPWLGGVASVTSSAGVLYGPNGIVVVSGGLPVGLGTFRQDTGNPATFYGWFQAASSSSGDLYLTTHKNLNHQISAARLYVSATVTPAQLWASIPTGS